MNKLSGLQAILLLLLLPQPDEKYVTATWSYQEIDISGFLLFHDKNNDGEFLNDEILADIPKSSARQWEGVVALRKGRNTFVIMAYKDGLKSTLSEPAYIQQN